MARRRPAPDAAPRGSLLRPAPFWFVFLCAALLTVARQGPGEALRWIALLPFGALVAATAAAAFWVLRSALREARAARAPCPEGTFGLSATERAAYYADALRDAESPRGRNGDLARRMRLSALLHDVERSPNVEALGFVAYLVGQAPDADLRHRAAALLPAIQDLADRQRAGQVLLRPADPGTDALLRVPEPDNEALLRAAEGEGDGRG